MSLNEADKAKIVKDGFLITVEPEDVYGFDTDVYAGLSLSRSFDKKVTLSIAGVEEYSDTSEIALNPKEARELGAYLLGAGLDRDDPTAILESLLEEPIATSLSTPGLAKDFDTPSSSLGNPEELIDILNSMAKSHNYVALLSMDPLDPFIQRKLTDVAHVELISRELRGSAGHGGNSTLDLEVLVTKPNGNDTSSCKWRCVLLTSHPGTDPGFSRAATLLKEGKLSLDFFDQNLNETKLKTSWVMTSYKEGRVR